jgi:acetylornithine deacetylase/succinyl-diaminopimelate desuccinylase-like protein
MHLKAIETCLSEGSLPVNLKLIIEGEEEVGSPHFVDLIRAHREDLRCDVACISDSSFFEKGVPSLDTGLRGLVSLEATVTAAKQDCHSGEFGGAVANPIRALAKILASLHDEDNRVNVPGFYDDVLDATAEERSQFALLPFEEAKFLSNAGGAQAAVGETGWTSLERTWVRPTLEYNGITGGFQGEGSKTIIPARASVKITCRLVPNQDPDDISKKVTDAIRGRVPEGVTVDITGHAHAYPVLTPMDHPAVVAAREAIEKAFGKRAVVARMGGTIPPVALFQKELGVPTVLAGFGLPDDHLHGPNEKFDLEQYFGGIRAMAYLWNQLPAVMPAKV